MKIQQMCIDNSNSPWEYEGLVITGKDYLIVEDNFGREWKLVPITNPNIEMPFLVVPLERKK